MATQLRLGIDIGGSGIKGAPVDVDAGVLQQDRYRLPTPQPATPDSVGQVIAQLAEHFAWSGPIGCTYPGVVCGGVARSAANVDRSWIGVNIAEQFGRASGCPVTVLNDADAAGLAEVRCGAARGYPGVILLLTLGTGIGSALLVDGRVVPNTELGHMEIDGREAEAWASDRVRTAEGLSWAAWAGRLDRVLHRLDALFSPDLFLIGGGVSDDHEQFLPLLTVRAPVRPARLRNRAGIIGAAIAASAAPQAPPVAAPER